MEGVATELGPTIDELVEIARAAGETNASRRTIRHWVSKRDVSRPARSGRDWLYPNVSIGQVETVARLRSGDVEPALIRFALFIETSTVPVEEALSIVRDVLTLWGEVLESEGARLREDPNALADEAAKAARMRGQAPLPHRVRGVSIEARTLAMTVAIGRLFSVPVSPEEAEEGLHHFERILGLRSGRGGADRDLEDTTLKPGDWPDDPVALRAAVDSATPERIEFACRGVEFAVAWLPAMRGVLATWFGPSFTPLADILAEWAEKLTPDICALLFAMFLRNCAERASDREIHDALQVFEPARITVEMLGERSLHERNVVSRRLRPYQRLQFERIHARHPVATGSG